ncbi:MAG: hypothetical protein D6776_09085 [Planctomycetota bacterium]|nr:MAG: hypothetical protein D6776_09085 [Planctomycetota bacterium]
MTVRPTACARPGLFAALALALLAPIATAASSSTLKREVIAALAEGRVAAARDAVQRLEREGDRSAANALIDLLTRLPDGEVREAVAQALSRMPQPEAAQAIAQKLRGGSVARRLLLADVAAHRSDPATREALIACLRHNDDALVRAATRALVQRREPEAVEPLIDLLERREGKPGSGAGLIRRALEELTGKSLYLAIEWRSWWTAHKDEGLPGREAAMEAIEKSEGSGGTQSRFFGRELASDRIVFVIDVSGSMQKKDPVPDDGASLSGDGPPRTTSRVRLERAKAELLGAIDGLPETARFTIIAYSGYLPPGTPQPPGITLPNEHNWLRLLSKRLVRADAKGKEKAKRFVEGLKAIGSTFTGRAIEAALEIRDADLIVLLSDGEPTEWVDDGGHVKRLSADEVRERIRAANRSHRITIDTFGFEGGDFAGGDDRFTRFMKGVAEDNGGRFSPIH